jgi:hypothetical protein
MPAKTGNKEINPSVKCACQIAKIDSTLVKLRDREYVRMHSVVPAAEKISRWREKRNNRFIESFAKADTAFNKLMIKCER